MDIFANTRITYNVFLPQSKLTIRLKAISTSEYINFKSLFTDYIIKAETSIHNEDEITEEEMRNLDLKLNELLYNQIHEEDRKIKFPNIKDFLKVITDKDRQVLILYIILLSFNKQLEENYVCTNMITDEESGEIKQCGYSSAIAIEMDDLIKKLVEESSTKKYDELEFPNIRKELYISGRDEKLWVFEKNNLEHVKKENDFYIKIVYGPVTLLDKQSYSKLFTYSSIKDNSILSDLGFYFAFTVIKEFELYNNGESLSYIKNLHIKSLFDVFSKFRSNIFNQLVEIIQREVDDEIKESIYPQPIIYNFKCPNCGGDLNVAFEPITQFFRKISPNSGEFGSGDNEFNNDREKTFNEANTKFRTSDGNGMEHVDSRINGNENGIGNREEQQSTARKVDEKLD